MNINDERTASPMAGDPSGQTRSHASSPEGDAYSDMRNVPGDSPPGSLYPGWKAYDDTGAFSRPMATDAVGAERSAHAGHEPHFFYNYLRDNLPAILIVCIVAAAIGVATGVHFAAEPNDRAAVAILPVAQPMQGRMTDSPASPSDTMMLRIEEMRKIAAEDAVDVGSSAAGAGNPSPALEGSENYAEKNAEKYADGVPKAAPQQPAAASQAGRPCTDASMALALCDHR